MKKKRIISIVTNAAKQYHVNLENQKVLFVYGIPGEVRRQIKNNDAIINCLDYYEVAFYKSNFLHLTGLKIKNKTVKSAIHFYSKCLNGRLSEKDFSISEDGSTIQKLEVLEYMMNIKKNASMIGDFSDTGPKLYSDKIAGNTNACMGFVRDEYTNNNVPNTLLKNDIRNVSSKPQNKIYLVLSKPISEGKYTVDKCDKSIEISKILLP